MFKLKIKLFDKGLNKFVEINQENWLVSGGGAIYKNYGGELVATEYDNYILYILIGIDSEGKEIYEQVKFIADYPEKEFTIKKEE